MVNASETILLTGLPRSGTTLCCHILNQFENTVALHEPMVPEILPADVPGTLAAINDFVVDAREQACRGNPLPSKQLGGAIPDNPVSPVVAGERRETVVLGEIKARKPLTRDFRLVIKHNALFTALSEQLRLDFSLFALVRNPLPVLASWNSVNLPVGEGRVPMGERFDENLKLTLDAEADSFKRQLILLKWFFDIFRSFPPENILTYENLVRTDGNLLRRLSPFERSESSKINAQFKNSGLDAQELKSLSSALLERPDIYEGCYSRTDIENNLEEMLQ